MTVLGAPETLIGMSLPAIGAPATFLGEPMAASAAPEPSIGSSLRRFLGSETRDGLIGEKGRGIGGKRDPKRRSLLSRRHGP
jgi:hypothetical protein